MIRALLGYVGYWFRPYDAVADRRRWFWQPRALCGSAQIAEWMRHQSKCPDCAAPFSGTHDAGCDVARCLVTGHQRLSCRASHDHGEDRWSGRWPGSADAARFGVTLNDLHRPAFTWDKETLRWERSK